MKYEVPVIFSGCITYLIEADTPDQARDKAKQGFSREQLQIELSRDTYGGNLGITVRIGKAEEVKNIDK